MGGFNKPNLQNALNFAISSDIEVYDTHTDTWSTIPSLPETASCWHCITEWHAVSDWRIYKITILYLECGGHRVPITIWQHWSGDSSNRCPPLEAHSG
ncbi:MAG: hypothetical protein ACWA6R_12735 [Nitrosomonas sp.]